jgi:hypothetical protein
VSARVLRAESPEDRARVERALEQLFATVETREAPGGELVRLGEVLTRWIGAGAGSEPDAETCNDNGEVK